MAGDASKKNGEKGGRSLGHKNDKTLLLEAEHEAFQQLVLQNRRPLFDAQLSIAKGITFVYRTTLGKRGGKSDPELVTDPEEIAEAIRMIAVGDDYADVTAEGDEGTIATTPLQPRRPIVAPSTAS
jgi:hypothetical protein